MDVRAPAKINLMLRILAREASGFHRIETLFARLDLADRLRIEDGPPGVLLEVTGADVGPAEDNLVTRAARAWAEAAGAPLALRILLEKHVPAGAGLGGGSSDAAATLRALDLRAEHPLGPARLHQLGAGLGSDVPFFLGAPYALAWGRGDRSMALPSPPDRPVIVAIADPPVSTRDAYAAIARHGYRTPPPLPEAATLSTWEGIADVAANDFEDVLRDRLPNGLRLRDGFEADGAVVARLSGSGAAVFGVFADESVAERAAERARQRVPDARIVRTRTGFGT